MDNGIYAQSNKQLFIRKAVVDSALSQVGIFERTNSNDGAVDKYRKEFKNLGSHRGDAYCSWGLLYCFKANGIRVLPDGRAVSWSYPKSSVLRYFGEVVSKRPVRIGDVALSQSWDNVRQRWQYHIEIIIYYNPKSDSCQTVGFNTWGKLKGKRKQGVWKHNRLKQNLIICNQFKYFFKDEKTTNRLYDILYRLQRERLPEN